jgi:cysteinyl-tRNA synthetase
MACSGFEVAQYKKNPFAFVLWNPSDAAQPGWDSPWGRGRPGWHIECSAMSGALLGETFDIHGGGIDLVFPHHENEIAQSRCAFHTKVMANYWMHNGFLMVEGEKMAKSLGNFITIREVLKDWQFGEVARFNMLRTHYRQPIDWTSAGLRESAVILEHWKRWYLDCATDDFFADYDRDEVYPPVLEALCDDLNTPLAIAALHQLVGKLSSREPDVEKNRYFAWFGATIRLLGFETIREVDFNRAAAGRLVRAGIRTEDVDELVLARTAARKAKDFKESDRIRDELLAMGVVLKDGKDLQTGEPVTTWEVAR